MSPPCEASAVPDGSSSPRRAEMTSALADTSGNAKRYRSYSSRVTIPLRRLRSTILRSKRMSRGVASLRMVLPYNVGSTVKLRGGDRTNDASGRQERGAGDRSIPTPAQSKSHARAAHGESPRPPCAVHGKQTLRPLPHDPIRVAFAPLRSLPGSSRLRGVCPHRWVRSTERPPPSLRSRCRRLRGHLTAYAALVDWDITQHLLDVHATADVGGLVASRTAGASAHGLVLLSSHESRRGCEEIRRPWVSGKPWLRPR